MLVYLTSPGEQYNVKSPFFGVQVDTDFTNDDDVRAILIVHDTKPPFLDGRVVYTKQSQAVLPLRDPTSDMAVIARNGSQLVREVREKKEKNKSRQRFWELAGSKMGKITGVCTLVSCTLDSPERERPVSCRAMQGAVVMLPLFMIPIEG